MQFTPIDHEEKTPFVQLLLLGVYVVVGLAVGALLGFAVSLAVYGLALVKDLSWSTGQDLERVGALKIILVAQSIGMFLLPALALSWTERSGLSRFYGLARPRAMYLLLVLLLMAVSLPIFGLVTSINAEMHLPQFLKGLEKWMRQKEDEALTITKAILTTGSLAGLLANLFVIALVPAVAEEFLFRGALQRTLSRMARNHHVAIWVSAFVFSAIHLQFFGFFPRVLLGAAFGYIYFWSGNIWYAVFAHFLNNAYVVVFSYVLAKKNIPIEKADDMDVNWIVYMISAVLTLALLKYLRDRAKLDIDPTKEIQ